jgi:hypothetical protein
MTRAVVATASLLFALTLARPFAAQPPSRLTLTFEDYAALPITADNTNDNTRAQLARVNYLRDEPGGRRFFVNDLNGSLYIFDKQTKTFTTYLDFNGAGGRPGLFPKFTFERNFATGLTNFIFDPVGLDLSGYTTTPGIATPTVNGRIEREVVLIEWTDRNPSNNTFEGTARELLRLQEPLPIHPLGEMTFNPAARPGDAEWRVMYLGAGDSGSGEQRDARRMNPQRLDTLVGKILRIVPDASRFPSSRSSGASNRRISPTTSGTTARRIDIFTVIKRGVPSTMMPGLTGQLTDEEIWHVVNYVRSLRPRQ